MSIPQERFNDIFKKLTDNDKEQAIDFMEFLYEKRKRDWKKALENVPDEDEELSPEELQDLKDAENDDSEPIETVAKELGLKWR